MSKKIRIIYGCPASNLPTGGVKVIYRHSEVLNQLGICSKIWHPGSKDFKCDWFEHSAETITDSELDPTSDFIVFPEIWATAFISKYKNMGFKVGIFVQNCYLTHINLNNENPNGIADAYAQSDIVLSISNDTSLYLEDIFKIPENKIILQRYSVDPVIFSPGNKEKLITYMPRKMADHSTRWLTSILPLLPEHWSIKPLKNMSETEIASNLNQSIVFMAFSEFEGLPVPPVEAALSGNIVIGYHGQGGKEYWRSPNFIEVDQGDIQGLIFELLDTISEIESGQIDISELNRGINWLRNYFSTNTESLMLINFASSVEQFF